MKKSLLISASLLLAASTMTAAAPEGDLYLMGLNGQTTQDATNLFILGERSEEDIDEGLWRWTIPSIEVTAEEGTLTVADASGFSAGYNPALEEIGMTNMLNANGMVSLIAGGNPVNYNLKPGEYSFTLALFEDLDGDMGGDSWMLQAVSLSAEPDESYYLIGFDGNVEPSAAVRFVKNVEEFEDEVMISYTLPKFYVGECPDGFTVLDAANEVSYGLDPVMGADTPEITDESYATFLAANGEPVACKLTPGYYDITFAPIGAMNMISFLKSENQTPNEELEYCLVGLNGNTSLDAAPKFERTLETIEYEEDGELISYENVVYTLTAEVEDDCELTVVSATGDVVFGYNSDMSAFLANNFSEAMPFTMLVTNGEPLNCTLPAGKYTFKMTVDGTTASLSAEDASDGAVEDLLGEDSDVAPVYYDLQGRQVKNPAKGIYIVKRGSKVSKVIL